MLRARMTNLTFFSVYVFRGDACRQHNFHKIRNIFSCMCRNVVLWSGYLPSLLIAIAKVDYFCVFLFALLCMIFCPKKNHLKMEGLSS